MRATIALLEILAAVLVESFAGEIAENTRVVVGPAVTL